jgi:hypothetical protein
MKILTGEEKKTIYPVLFERIFGVKPEKQIPRIVMTDDKMEGFISGYLIDQENFYMSWVGHINGMIGVRRAFNDMESAMIETGVKYFIGRVHNRNTVVQRLMLGMNWFPRGIVAASDGLYVEYIKEL